MEEDAEFVLVTALEHLEDGSRRVLEHAIAEAGFGVRIPVTDLEFHEGPALTKLHR